MEQKPIYTPVERLDGLLETENRAEKWMHQSRYQMAAARLRNRARNSATPLQILDIACGMGYGSKILAQKLDARVTSLDIDPQALEYARAHHNDQRISHGLSSITQIEADDASFDAVVCYETIEHVNYEDAFKALGELNRVLKPGGTLFISTPNRYFTFLLQKMGMSNPFHFYEFRPEELARLLQNQGFDMRHIYGQTLALPATYYAGRAGKLAHTLFFPRRSLPSQFCMIAILEAQKSA